MVIGVNFKNVIITSVDAQQECKLQGKIARDPLKIL